MPDYRAYVVDADGHIKTFVVVTAIDDQSAIEATKLLVDGHDIELWHLDRKVALLPHKN